jgi:hypothetical protein
MALNHKRLSWAGSTPPSYLRGLRFEVSVYRPALLIEVSCEFNSLFSVKARIPVISSHSFLINY